MTNFLCRSWTWNQNNFSVYCPCLKKKWLVQGFALPHLVQQQWRQKSIHAYIPMHNQRTKLFTLQHLIAMQLIAMQLYSRNTQQNFTNYFIKEFFILFLNNVIAFHACIHLVSRRRPEESVAVLLIGMIPSITKSSLKTLQSLMVSSSLLYMDNKLLLIPLVYPIMLINNTYMYTFRLC